MKLHRKILMIFDKYISPRTQYSMLSLEDLQEYLLRDFNMPISTDELLQEIKEMEIEGIILLDEDNNVHRLE